MIVAIIDYGMGNLGSVSRAIANLGAEPLTTDQPARLAQADRVVLPGVGSFADGMTHLRERGWVSAIHEHVAAGKPLLGICLGMQLLASRGSEGGDTAGLDLVPGSVRHLEVLNCRERIPHVGWNNVRLLQQGSAILAGIPDGTDFYFVHSFAFSGTDPGHVLAEVDYGVPLLAAVGRRNVFGTQFHPEKSSKAGFRVLKNFLDHRPC